MSFDLQVPAENVGPAGPWCQRWRRQRDAWRHTSEGGFDPKRFEVARIPERQAKEFVVEHHYSGSMPAARSCWGIFDTDEVLGVAVLSVPVTNKVTQVVFPDLVPVHEALELGRFVLLDEVPANAESWFLARVLRDAANDGIKGVVSFSDPVPRVGLDGREIRRGHVGTVYQASNAIYAARGAPRTLRLYGDGRVVNGKSLQKFRDGRNGDYLYRELCSYGARPMRPGEDRLTWLAEALDAVTVARRHRGNHRFAFPVGRTRSDRASVRINVAGQPYPKTLDEPMNLG
jgi:hypothetical protein